jgi:hypothetical protein
LAPDTRPRIRVLALSPLQNAAESSIWLSAGTVCTANASSRHCRAAFMPGGGSKISTTRKLRRASSPGVVVKLVAWPQWRPCMASVNRRLESVLVAAERIADDHDMQVAAGGGIGELTGVVRRGDVELRQPDTARAGGHQNEGC